MIEGAASQGFHREFVARKSRNIANRGLFEFPKDAVAHFGGSGVGEGDGDDLAGGIHLSQQAKEATGEQVGFARAGRGLHQNRARRIEGLLALRLVGRE
jgi:hypothetical protein